MYEHMHLYMFLCIWFRCCQCLPHDVIFVT